MFYTEGDLRSGIDKAVRESKLVACLVAGSDDESLLWETDFIQEPNLSALLAARTVLLRLEAGSQEAGFLAAIYPLPKTTTFVLIDNGQLKEYLTAGTSKEDFTRRLLAILATPEASESVTSERSGQAQEAHLQVDQTPYTAETKQPEETEAQNPPPAVQALLAERSARLEAERKEQEARDKQKRAAEAKARREAQESAAPPVSQQSADMKYALMQKKRQQEKREERARILKRVEDDKAERRERAARNRAQSQKEESEDSQNIQIPASDKSHEVAIQVRLFDGSTIKSWFSSEGTIRASLRPFVDEKLGADIPYKFKQVLTPSPNKDISVGEEDHSFAKLGFMPSATLITVPVSGYISAYEENTITGAITRQVSAVFGLVTSPLRAVTGMVGGLLSGAAPDATQHQATTPIAASHVTTLRDQQPDDQQLYNGNALNFEPRRDDDSEDKAEGFEKPSWET